MRILIAEDDRMSRTFLSRFLSEYGDVDVATDGMEALDLLMDAARKNMNYDLLCLDIMMPKVSGIQVLKVVRTMEKQHGVPQEDHLPVIMMTALTDMDYVDQAFDLGCDAYASKPLELGKVEGLMRDLGLIA
ncbi:MAG: response regulator transcription factor [Selenomonadaceae bacterium]|nr:response regulator transcription factor [Selenomonadaceae bacterium]MBQ3971686.1 response regulator transcription factor [Selenomonadaceae bacterium]